MTSKKNLEDIKHIIHISSNDEPCCKICEDGWSRKLHDFEYAINHYIEEHGYTLLYIGNETNKNKNTGEILDCTVAVLGSDLGRCTK